MLLNAFFKPERRNLLAVPKSTFMASHETDRKINNSTIEKTGIWKTPASNAPAVGSKNQITVLDSAHNTKAAGIM